MVVLYVLIVLLALWGVGLQKSENTAEYEYTYLSKERTDSVKGLFILTVFLRHANQYVRDGGYDYSSIGDRVFLLIDGWLGQLIVVMFLFFSGYGVMQSYLRKGNNYIRAIPKHRTLNTLINFDVAVVVFAAIGFLMGTTYDAKTYLLSLIAWESIGNSTWYIFVILACYLSTWISFSLFHNQKYALMFNALVLVLVWAGLLYAGKLSCWYNTIMAYPFGLAVGMNKEIFHQFNKKWYWLLLIFAFGIVVVSEYVPFQMRGVIHNIRAIAFAEMILLLMMRVKIQNKVIIWLGTNLFILYIYQRIPMLLLNEYFCFSPIIFITLSILLTCLLVPVINKIQIKL